MKRLFLFFCLMVSTLIAVSQTKVSFTGVTLNGTYCPFDLVNVTNITRGWSETLVYPDTVIILSGLGVEEISSSREGIVRVYPNPFMDFTNVEFSVPESGLVDVSVVGVDGMEEVSWKGYVQSGIHQLRISLEKPQMAFVVITTNRGRYVGKLLHVGGGSINEIELCSISTVISDRSNGSERLVGEGEFMPGDVMSYEGLILKDEDRIFSNKVTQAQYGDETISLVFPVSEPSGDEVMVLPYYQDFISSFGTYTTYDVFGAQSWEIDYNTAKMSGYSNNTYYRNEDWLISAKFSLENVYQACMTMTYILRYLNNVNDITIQVSSDYISGDPNMANWTQVPATWTQSPNWNDFASTTIDLSQFVGQKVCLAVKYLSNETNACTIEVQSILIQEGSGPTPPPGPGTGGEVQNLPYTQSFTSEFGTYMTYDVMGPQSWVIEYNSATISGHVNGTNNANEDWLISSPVAITGVDDAKMTMVYIVRYFNNINEDISICASTDYTWSTDPMTASWIRVPVSLSVGNNWNDFLTAEIPLTQFVGQTVTFAVVYTSTDNWAGTIEIQSITIEEGSGVTPPPGTGGELQSMPYTQSFANEFGTYMTYDVLGPQSWMIDYHTAKMTGYVNSSYYANEDWLISSPVAITGVSDAKMTMVYIGRYFNNINNEVTIWASTNYTWGSEPNLANWEQVPAALVEGSNWNDFITTEISLSDYVGKTVTFAVKYISTDSKAGTMEIQSITIEEGSGVTPPTPPTPGEGEGSGTAADPYNVAAGIGLQGEEPIAWVHGYIVGAVKSGLSSVTSNADINWTGPFDLATNVVIADDVSCREISQCIIVNLPAGKPLRTQVNLVDNPGNLGKHLAVNGKLRKYFGQAGLRDSGGTTNDFVLEGGDTPPTPGTTIFSESFSNGQGQFTIQDVTLPPALSYVWKHDSQYSCMKASAYVSGQNHAAESWLVSPTIDLSGVSDATLRFEQAVNYAAPQGALTMMISANYNGDVTTATWNELSLDQWPAGNNWIFITSSADLSSYVGQQVTIAFKYTSSTSASATWEVKNFLVE